MSDDIVITGMGVVSPIGVGEAEFWDALCAGRTGAAPIGCLDTTDLSRRLGCQVKDFPGDDATHSVGRAAQLATAAARQAMASAGIANANGRALLDSQRVSVIVGTTMGETEFIEDRLSAGADEWLSPDHVQRILSGRPGSIAANVARNLFHAADDQSATTCGERSLAGKSPSQQTTRSPNHQITKSQDYETARLPNALDLYGACAAGNMAIESARRQLRSGRCDLAIAGGADGFSRLAFIGFMRLRVMAAEVCRPFDVARDGLFVGEGSAMFVLERESSAKARGAAGRILGRVIGAGNAGEDYHPTRPHPEGDGLSRAIAAALGDAGLTAADIDYICAHGTGTPQNDAIEVSVMNRMFPAGTPFSSIKALTGHCMGAAAAIEAAACLLMLRHQMLIPTWNLANVLQPCTLDAVAGGPRPARLRTAINNSAGFGGYNSSVILGV